MLKIVEASHLIIREYLNCVSLNFIRCLDATCGAGNDTLFLSSNLKDKGHIDAYDIQEKAIELTKQKINTDGYNNVSYYLKSHDTINPSNYDLAIFNLGYLPGTDKSITTNHISTMKAIKSLTEEIINNPLLLIIIAVYPGHEEGKIESNLIDEYVKNLSSSLYLVTKYQNYNRNLSPYLITISKNKR